MRKVFLAIGVLFVLMVFTSVQSFAEPGGKGPKPKSGGASIYVYDDNNQYLGVYAGYAPGAGVMSGSVFNPTLKLFFVFEDGPGESNYGNVKDDAYNIDGQGNIWLWQRDRLIQLSDGTYVAGIGNALYINNIGWRYDYREVLIEEIPFSLPVAMPLRYDTQAP